ncbi:class III lanthipeptide [Bacillus manliponensis]
MKDVLALQQLNEGTDVQPEWTSVTWTVTGFMSTVSNNC